MSSATETTPPAPSAAKPSTPAAAGKVFRAGLVGLVYLMNTGLWYWLTPRIVDLDQSMRVPLSATSLYLVHWSDFLRWHMVFTLPALLAVGALHARAVCQTGSLRRVAAWLALALFLFFVLAVVVLFANGIVDILAHPPKAAH